MGKMITCTFVGSAPSGKRDLGWRPSPISRTKDAYAASSFISLRDGETHAYRLWPLVAGGKSRVDAVCCRSVLNDWGSLPPVSTHEHGFTVYLKFVPHWIAKCDVKRLDAVFMHHT